ncbi:MAG: hypothetical protein A3K65_04110 [Euryarchaeota archaeon RBG_16_68_12]|nr:MAG: hypothetical protein A3K65_04110 [Euryarchaeota archaeon RBG_16_68_12]
MPAEAVIVPEETFLRYRYEILVASTVVAVASVAWLVPLVPAEYGGLALALFLLWTVSILAPAAAAAAWYPAHTRSLRYVLQEDRLVVLEGVWFRSQKFVPYSRITDVTIRQGPLERRFRIHRLAVQTAGSPMPEAVLLGIGDPERVRAALLAKKALADEGTEDLEETPLAVLQEIREELRAIRTLSAESRRP